MQVWGATKNTLGISLQASLGHTTLASAQLTHHLLSILHEYHCSVSLTPKQSLAHERRQPAMKGQSSAPTHPPPDVSHARLLHSLPSLSPSADACCPAEPNSHGCRVSQTDPTMPWGMSQILDFYHVVSGGSASSFFQKLHLCSEKNK